MSKKKKKDEGESEAPIDALNAVNREDCDCPCHWMPRWIRRPRFMRRWEWDDTSATLAILTATACTAVAYKLYQRHLLESGQQQKRSNEYWEAVKPIIVAINTEDGDGVQQQGTGILISDHLVLTSHMGLPSRESARDGQITLRNVGSSNSSPNRLSSSPTILTRKLLPHRLFVTNPRLGTTIVACEPVNSSLPPRNYEVPKAPEDRLKLGCSVYVLGEVQHDDREGLLMFGEGLVSKEDEQVIEFYSLDGFVWAPGSTGFDADGTLAFVVGDRRPSHKVTCPLRKRWSYALSKGPSSTQPGILIHAVRDWTKDTWFRDSHTLLQLCDSSTALVEPTFAFKQKAKEHNAPERQKALSRRTDQIQNTISDDRDTTIAKLEGGRPSIQDCEENLYRAADSNSTITSPKIKEIHVQASFLPLPVLVPSNLAPEAQICTPIPQSSPKLGGIAALAAEELERHDGKNEHFQPRVEAGSQTANSPFHDCVDGLVDFHSNQEIIYNGMPPCGSTQQELKSRRRCWLSSCWGNFRPKLPQQQRGQNLQVAVADYAAATECVKFGAGRAEEVTTDCLEPNSPPRRFLVRGALTATPRREFSSQQTAPNMLNPEGTKPTSPRNSFSRLDNRIKPVSPPSILHPCESTQASSRPLSPETTYLEIHRSPSGGCPQQADNLCQLPGESNSRRLHPLRPLIGVARARTYPRDYCPPRSEEDEQKKLDGSAVRKVYAGTCVKVVECDATGSQDCFVERQIAVQTLPRLLRGKNGMLESGSSRCPPESPTGQGTHDHEVLGLNRVISSELIRQSSTSILTSGKTSERVIECTYFQRWQKFVSRKKTIAVESMKSLISPRSISNVSTASPRSISPCSVPGSPPQIYQQLREGAIATWFMRSPSSIPKEQVLNTRKEEAPNTISRAQMPNWAMKQQNVQDQILDQLGIRQVLASRGEHEGKNNLEEVAAAEVKICNGSCIATVSGQNDVGAEDRSPSTTSRNNSPRMDKYMNTVSKKERNEQRKETRSNQRPRWSIARIDKRPLNSGSLLDPLDDLTKSKVRMKKQKTPLKNTGAIRAIVCHQEESMFEENSGGLRPLENQNEVPTLRKAENEEEGQTGPSSASTKLGLNSNCKAKISTKDSANLMLSTGPSKPVRSLSKRLLETPIVRKGSSASVSSSDTEGRPRWRCP